ncbi:ATP-binding cassette domain-containing protein [Anaerobranca californiensis]|jgi:ABC-type multidrug transport system fused ATPase/permease subunit|nr:ABC transporter ATP-binding protein [Anaerobranca californiensis]
METRMDYFSNIEDTIKNKEEITIYNAISGEVKRNDYYTDKIKKLAAKLYSKYFAIFFIKLDFLRIFYELFVFSFSLYQVYTNNYSIGTAIVLIGYSVMITGPISYLNSILLNIKNSINAIDFLRELDVEEEQGEFLEKGIENISFNKVNYSVDGREILKDLSFTINKGEKIALLGPSGKGKSTIVSLILKDIPLTNGQITINNIDLKGIAKEYLYAQIAVLSQTSRLFPGTVEENLCLGKKGSNKEELEEMLKKFKLPFQLQYRIDENSANISQGEKERILLARALLANKNFVILDEPLEGVDLQNKGEILSYLKNYLEDKTAIIITHREEVGAICNKVIKL